MCNLVAVDYNEQNYFELTEYEFKNCETMSKHLFVCNSNVIKKIDKPQLHPWLPLLPSRRAQYVPFEETHLAVNNLEETTNEKKPGCSSSATQQK